MIVQQQLDGVVDGKRIAMVRIGARCDSYELSSLFRKHAYAKLSDDVKTCLDVPRNVWTSSCFRVYTLSDCEVEEVFLLIVQH